MSTLNPSPGIASPGMNAPASSNNPANAPAPTYGVPERRRARPRINVRLIVVLALVALPFLYFGYVILDQSLNGGINNRGSYYDVDLKSLGYFPFDAAKDDINSVPQRWRALDGKRVALQGEMFDPMSAGDKLNSFQLVYSIQKCCFNGPPRVQERVFAKVPNGAKVGYYPQVVRVVGTLHVGARRDEFGNISSIYDLDVESVDPA